MSIEQIKVADGKYQVFHERGKLWALRNGEPWSRDLTGDNLIYWMMMRILELESARAQAQRALDDICGAKLCEFNSMSSRHEMIRLMDCAIDELRSALAMQPVQATKAEVTDAAIDAATRHIYHNGLPTSKEYRVGIARAILALRPQAAPMTEEQAEELAYQAFKDHMEDRNDDMEIDLVHKVERFHRIGITAQAKKEGA